MKKLHLKEEWIIFKVKLSIIFCTLSLRGIITRLLKLKGS
jgi:hypothetical protein